MGVSMRDTSTSTIAQLLYARPLHMHFAMLVGELNSALAKCDAVDRSFAWDCDDVAIFDLDGARVIMSLADNPGGGHACCLSVSVGPSPVADPEVPAIQRGAMMCRMIVDRIQTRFPPAAVAWHNLPGPVTPDRLETLLAQLPTAQELEVPSKAQLCFPPLAPVHPEAANDRPDLPRRQSGNETVRSALYPEGAPWQGEKKPANVNATPMRLAIHTMNATLILVAMPVGAAMMTYSLLRGEDLRLTSQAMVLTGLGTVFLQSDLGRSLIAMI